MAKLFLYAFIASTYSVVIRGEVVQPDSNQPPKLTFVHPENVTTIQGYDATFTCEVPVSFISNQYLFWLKGYTLNDAKNIISSNEIIKPSFDSGRFHVNLHITNTQAISTLTISNTSAEDADGYYCGISKNSTITNGKRLRFSRVASLGIVQRPTFDCNTYPEAAQVDDTVTFKCSFRENITVPLALAWKRGSSQIVSMEESDGRSHSVTQTLQETDNYERFACVFEGEEVCSATPIRVPLTLQIVQTPENVNLYDEVSFSCVPNINYPPVSEFLWTIIRGNESEQLNVSSGIYIIQNNGDLSINSLNESDVDTLISCSATNAIGVTSNSSLFRISIAFQWGFIFDTKHILISACVILILLIIIVALCFLYTKAKPDSRGKDSTRAQTSEDQGQAGSELATNIQTNGIPHQPPLNDNSVEYMDMAGSPVALDVEAQTSSRWTDQQQSSNSIDPIGPQIIGSMPNGSKTNNRQSGQKYDVPQPTYCSQSGVFEIADQGQYSEISNPVNSVPNGSGINSRQQSEHKYDVPHCGLRVPRWSDVSEDSNGYVRPRRTLNDEEIGAIVEVDEPPSSS